MSDVNTRFAEFFSKPSPVDVNRTPIITGHELLDILAPMTLPDFFNHYFNKQSVLIRGGGRKKLDYVTLERLRFLLNSPAPPQASSFGLSAHFRRSSIDEHFKVSRHEVGHLLDAGGTICLTGLHLIDPELYCLTRALKVQSLSAGDVSINCYVSPDGGGFRKHFDSRTALVVQLAGTKLWRYAKLPVVEFPQASGRELDGKIEFGADGYKGTDLYEPSKTAEAEQFEECLLEPGDVLCMPPGTWHSACARDFSLAVTISFFPMNFSAMLFSVMEAELGKHTVWRAGPPSAPGGPLDEPPHLVRSYFRSRLAELRATIDSFDENDPRLWAAWYSDITRTVLKHESVDCPHPELGIWVGLNKTMPFCYYLVSRDGEDRIILQHGTARVTIKSVGLYPLIQELANGRVFQRGVVDRDLVEGFNAADIDQLWDLLLAVGITQFVDRTDA